MSTRHYLEKKILRSPYDRTLIRAFADWLFEHHNITFANACRIALKLSREKRRAHELAQATSLIRAGNNGANPICLAALAEANVSVHESSTIVVVPGHKWPRARGQNHYADGEPYFWQVVTVGALWVLVEGGYGRTCHKGPWVSKSPPGCWGQKI